jgi:ABC-type nitrate/sulfonate/bicarbonate transport system substrate-binding protein
VSGLLLTVIVMALFLWWPAHSVAAEQVCVQLKWLHQAQFAGFYVAKEKGYYMAEGLDVSFREGGATTDWQQQMRDGDCPVGITNAYEIVRARSNDIPVKALAAVAQVSPIVWFSLRESGIRDPRQFRDKRVVMVPTGEIHLKGMLQKVGVDIEDVHIVPFSLDMTPLYRGEVDVWSGYHTNLVTRAEEEGHELNVIHPVNYGVQIYDDVIYARQGVIESRPDLLEGFLRATLRGWEEAVRNPDHAVEHTMRYSRNGDQGHERRLLRRTIPYVHTGEVPIGWMEHDVWRDICRLTFRVKLIDRCVATGDIFTDRFLKLIYDEEGRP